MKDPLNRTKVVLRHLPPAMSQSVLMDQIDGRFSGRYNWVSFRPGKISHKNQRHSRAYVDLKRPEDVLEFAELFDGHKFVNEKGAQFKAVVEYAPSQRVPKPWSKKDGREGTIFKDPEYLEFLENLAKPVENLPSAEIQLERREAERAGVPKETFIVTPLMDFVRQKRAARNGSQRAICNGKVSRRAGVVSANSSNTSKRGSERRRGPMLMYVSRDNTKNGNGKDKATYILVSRREEQRLTDKSIAATTVNGANRNEDEAVYGKNGTISGVPGAAEMGKRRIVLLKGKERESSHVSVGLTRQQNTTSSSRNSASASALKQNQRQEASGRIIRSILSNKEGRQSSSYVTASQSEQQTQTVVLEKDKRPPRPPISRPTSKDYASSSSLLTYVSDNDSKKCIDEKIALNDHGFVCNGEKLDRRMRNRDRPDRGVWTPLRRSDGSHASEETLSSSSMSARMSSDSLESIQANENKVGSDDMGFRNVRGGHGTNSLVANEMAFGHRELKLDTPSSSRSADIKSLGSHGGGRGNVATVENVSHRHAGRRGPASGLKDVDNSLSIADGKPSKRGSAAYGSHERQMWVQKSGSAS